MAVSRRLFLTAEVAGTWTTVASGGTIGASRILLLPAPFVARRWRVRVTASRTRVHLSEFRLYRSRV
jgi:alpha-L-fucosidase